jgi:hypothetical protein
MSAELEKFEVREQWRPSAAAAAAEDCLLAAVSLNPFIFSTSAATVTAAK